MDIVQKNRMIRRYLLERSADKSVVVSDEDLAAYEPIGAAFDWIEANAPGLFDMATIEGDEPYPCIAVQINGMLLGIFEWDKIDKCFRYRIYSEDPFEEEPICKRHFSSKIEEDK